MNELDVLGSMLGISLGCSLCSIYLAVRIYCLSLTWIERMIPVIVEYEMCNERREKYPIASGEFPTSSEQLDKLLDEMVDYFSNDESDWEKYKRSFEC